MGLRQILARLGFVFTIARFGGNPCLPGDSVELDLIARVNRRAGARILALVFGFHCLNHNLPFDVIACTNTRPDAAIAGRIRSSIGQAQINHPVARAMGRETHNGRALALA